MAGFWQADPGSKREERGVVRTFGKGPIEYRECGTRASYPERCSRRFDRVSGHSRWAARESRVFPAPASHDLIENRTPLGCQRVDLPVGDLEVRPPLRSRARPLQEGASCAARGGIHWIQMDRSVEVGERAVPIPGVCPYPGAIEIGTHVAWRQLNRAIQVDESLARLPQHRRATPPVRIGFRVPGI